MADARPPVIVNLEWDGDQAFTAHDGVHEWVLDGRNQAGPTPVVALASSLAGCIAIDIVHILARGRFDVVALEVNLRGHRADTEPRRFVRVEMRIILDTNAPQEHIDRAIALSREKYCSVWHSMRQDIELETTVVRARPRSEAS
ncbi:MAG TPA: OsmC family protein [Vicinamibacterales bacterium]|nr:OsmC family protein [Vicinamibacterales bacterium]HOG27715.1 OsmC family protein [Vicinamibacterales bacterium]HOQ60604.1 OsmC family protein [Vicinamibacterales bacterium]HPK71723.1 OsmC family protein [Vicinamibacterales bacterium]HPW19287.1 OsmC family protein [Vicinamibacterales bacterium]